MMNILEIDLDLFWIFFLFFFLHIIEKKKIVCAQGKFLTQFGEIV